MVSNMLQLLDVSDFKLSLHAVVMVRLDQESYIVNELDGGLQACVILSEGSGIEDEDFFVEVSVSMSSDTVTGAVV